MRELLTDGMVSVERVGFRESSGTTMRNEKEIKKERQVHDLCHLWSFLEPAHSIAAAVNYLEIGTDGDFISFFFRMHITM